MGLFVVERGTPGFERGRPLEKIGMKAQDTAELFRVSRIYAGSSEIMREIISRSMGLDDRVPG
jgi:alkylation response protein AidB-like acyl-CoA dehydrogenase